MKILEVKIEYRENQVCRVVILGDYTSSSSKPLTDVRAIEATDKPKGGYHFIKPTDQVGPEMFEEVADYGFEVNNADKIFPGWKDRHK